MAIFLKFLAIFPRFLAIFLEKMAIFYSYPIQVTSLLNTNGIITQYNWHHYSIQVSPLLNTNKKEIATG